MLVSSSWNQHLLLLTTYYYGVVQVAMKLFIESTATILGENTLKQHVYSFQTILTSSVTAALKHSIIKENYAKATEH